MNNNFNEMLNDISCGNWTDAWNKYNKLPYELTPQEFSDTINSLSTDDVKNVALVGFYAMCNCDAKSTEINIKGE